MPDPLPISALERLTFCERQCALVHVEGMWEENRYTAEGNVLHAKAHEGGPETHAGVRIARGLDLRCRALNLVGKADVVEFTPPDGFTGPVADTVRAAAAAAVFDDGETGDGETGDGETGDGETGDGETGDGETGDGEDRDGQAAPRDRPTLAGWSVVPVEYKRGKPKTSPEWGDCDRVQLCGQALCLEEMLGVAVPAGRLFYGKTRRRTDVPFDAALRDLTRRAAERLHDLLASGRTPPAVNDSRCPNCSLIRQCLPAVTSGKKSAAAWTERALGRLADGS